MLSHVYLVCWLDSNGVHQHEVVTGIDRALSLRDGMIIHNASDVRVYRYQNPEEVY